MIPNNKWVSSFPVVPITPEYITFATKLVSMYRCKNPNIDRKQISFVDCLQSVPIIKNKGSSFIVTTDVNDYPSFLFELIHCIPIEKDNGSTIFVTFKTYNEDKWNKLLSMYEKSGQKKLKKQRDNIYNQ